MLSQLVPGTTWVDHLKQMDVLGKMCALSSERNEWCLTLSKSDATTTAEDWAHMRGIWQKMSQLYHQGAEKGFFKNLGTTRLDGINAKDLAHLPGNTKAEKVQHVVDYAKTWVEFEQRKKSGSIKAHHASV